MKRLEITDEIKARLQNSVGMAPENIAVFECIAVNTKPVSKRGSIYDKSVLAAHTLGEMAAYLQGAGNFVPLHVLHMQGYELPVGRVFYGAVTADDQGMPELRTQFYVDLTDQQGKDFAGKIDNGTIDEVSINVMPKHLNCSACGYDYLDPKNMEANRWAFWDRTCPNDHVVGQDGVHVIVNGMARFHELSLVSLGAANGAKIMPKTATKLNLSDEDRQNLAANGLQPEAIMFMASTKQPKEGKPAMADENKGGNAGIDPVMFATTLAEKQVAETNLKAANDKIASLEAQIAEIPALREKAAKFDAADAELTTAKDTIAKQAKFAATALGLKDTDVPANFAEQVKFIEDCGVKLHQAIPEGGLSLAADHGKGKQEEGVNRAASFSLNKK